MATITDIRLQAFWTKNSWDNFTSGCFHDKLKIENRMGSDTVTVSLFDLDDQKKKKKRLEENSMLHLFFFFFLRKLYCMFAFVIL